MISRSIPEPPLEATLRSYPHTRLALVISTVLLLGCLIAFVIWDITNDYRIAVKNVEKQTSSYAKAIKEHAERTLAELNRVLDTAVPQLEAVSLNQASQAELTRLLKQNYGKMPQLASLAVTDANGRLLASSVTSEKLQTIYLADRPFYKFHKEHNTGQQFINPPFKSRLNGKWRFSISRRLNNPNGSMAGILFAVIDLAYFEDLYKGLATNENSRFSLATLDGDYLVLVPGAEDVYKTGKKTAPFFRKLVSSAEAQTYHNKSSNIAKEHRIVSFHRLEQFPVVAIASFGHDQALARWRSSATTNALTTGFLSTAIILLVFLVLKQFRQLDVRVQERTAQLQLANRFLENEVQERLKGEQQLRDQQQRMEQLACHMALTEDKERSRIAGELHDQVGQRMILTKIRLDELISTTTDKSAAQSLLAVETLVDQSLQDIRSLTFQLRPPILATAGLLPALEWLVSELKRDYGLSVLIDTNGYEDGCCNFRYEIRSSLFQSARELLLNVVKHADVSDALLRLQSNPLQLVISVSDSGKGLPASLPPCITNNGGFGLYNLQQNIRFMGGTLQLESVPGFGTTATIMLPVRPELLEESPCHCVS